MPATALSTVLPRLRLSITQRSEVKLTDGDLLEQFITRHDGKAFESLLRQHGPMVLGVCRRILRNESDAEDAFQATFLVLIRKANSIVPRHMVGNWLYGVAYFTATKARAMSTRRTIRERAVTPREAANNRDATTELQAILDQELQALPDIYRSAIVLCDLEGKSIKQAALQFGCAVGTVGARLTRGRHMLAQRIKRRNSMLATGLLASCLASASASVPPSLLKVTTQASLQSACSAKVITLANAVIQSTLLSKLKLATVSFIVMAMSISSVVAGASMLNRPEVTAVAWQDSSENKLPQAAPQKPVLAAHFIWSVAFTPDAKSLVVSEGEKLVRLWDMKTNLPGKAFLGANKIIRSVAVSPDGKLLAGGGDEGIIYVWDMATQKLLYQINPKDGGIHTVAFSPDGVALASSHRQSDKTSCVNLYHAITGKNLYSFASNEGTIPHGTGIALAFRPDGKELAVVQQGHFTGITFVDCTDYKFKSTSKKIEYESPFIPESLAYSPDGKYLATGGIAPALPNPNNERLFGLPQGHVKIWDADTGKLVETLFDTADGNVKSLMFSRTTHCLYVGTSTKLGQPFQTNDGLIGILGGMYQCWDTSNWKLKWQAKTRGGITFGMALSADDKSLAIANSAGCWTGIHTAAEGRLMQIARTPESPSEKP